MELARLLAITPGVTAMIGGGGKTTLLRTLAAELSEKSRVIVCTTTHIYPEQTMRCLCSPTEKELAQALRETNGVCVGARTQNGKFCAPELPVCVLAGLAEYVLVEADGAKRLPLKAHAGHEPVIPPEANQTILVVGASGFGLPLRQSVHRAPLAAQKLGVGEDTCVTPELWARLIEQEALYTRVLINQVETQREKELAKALAARLHTPVCMAALQKGWIECLC